MSNDDAKDISKASTGIGKIEVYTEYGVDHPIFVDVLPPSTSEAIPQNEEGLTQASIHDEEDRIMHVKRRSEATVPKFELESGDEDWCQDNVLREELGSDNDKLFELQRQNLIRKQDKKGDILGMMANERGAEDDSGESYYRNSSDKESPYSPSENE
ncbi:hypothetical protein Ancab_005007, partial [Ancistrocladus abbreviatus]